MGVNSVDQIKTQIETLQKKANAPGVSSDDKLNYQKQIQKLSAELTKLLNGQTAQNARMDNGTSNINSKKSGNYNKTGNLDNERIFDYDFQKEKLEANIYNIKNSIDEINQELEFSDFTPEGETKLKQELARLQTKLSQEEAKKKQFDAQNNTIMEEDTSTIHASGSTQTSPNTSSYNVGSKTSHTKDSGISYNGKDFNSLSPSEKKNALNFYKSQVDQARKKVDASKTPIDKLKAERVLDILQQRLDYVNKLMQDDN